MTTGAITGIISIVVDIAILGVLVTLGVMFYRYMKDNRRH